MALLQTTGNWVGVVSSFLSNRYNNDATKTQNLRMTGVFISSQHTSSEHSWRSRSNGIEAAYCAIGCIYAHTYIPEQ